MYTSLVSVSFLLFLGNFPTLVYNNVLLYLSKNTLIEFCARNRMVFYEILKQEAPLFTYYIDKKSL